MIRVHVELARVARSLTYLEPFILFSDPARYHVIVSILVRRAQVNRVPSVRLEALLENFLQLRSHLGHLRACLLDFLSALGHRLPRSSKRSR